jgi:glycosyltransferase involved in cell wall biosynthesis
VTGVAIVIPALDEAATLPRLARLLAALDPPAAELLVVDGGSADATVEVARGLGLRVIEHGEANRARQINRGVAEATSEFVCVLHADTLPPDDMVAVIRRTLADPKVALGGFTPLISGPDKVRWVTSFHNWIKTWYAPLIMRPHLFVRGVRLLFGDHAMFFRRADFLAAGGCDPGMTVMEEADLCVKLARFGRVRLINRVILTSDRRIAAWGELKANWIYFQVGVRWALGLRRRLGERYPHVR